MRRGASSNDQPGDLDLDLDLDHLGLASPPGLPRPPTEVPIRPAALALPAAALLLLSACANKIDRFTLDKVVDVGSDVGDTRKACTMGEALVHPLGSLSKQRPDRAISIAEGNAAVCDELVAWEAELAAERVRHNGVALGEARVAEITDATLRAARAHGQAAARFERSYQALQAQFGELGAAEGWSCPKIKAKDEFGYAFGLVSGTLALLHDRQGGGTVGIPMDRLAVIARASECLDDETWWSLPLALRGSAWATVPGTGPEGVDPWQLLEQAAQQGEPSGVRVARAMQVLIAANSGRTDVMVPALRAHAASLQAVPQNTEWALLDAYAYEVSLHQSDLLWTRERGHRTETFGAVPEDATVAPQPTGPDPFEDDPFGAGAPEIPPEVPPEVPPEPAPEDPPSPR